MHDDDCDARQHVLDPVVEFGDQQILALFGPLAPRDIESQTLEADNSSGHVEFCFRRFLKPHLLPIRADETKGHRIAGPDGADLTDMRFETCAVVRMNPCEELVSGKSLVWIKAQDLRSVLAPLRLTAARIPFEGCDFPDLQRLLQPRFAVLDRRFMTPALGEQRRQYVGA